MTAPGPGASRATAGVAIVTGAGSGIGRATTLLLARHGWRVALAGRDRGRLEAAAREASGSREDPSRFLVLPGDLALPAEAARVVDEVEARFGRLDALVNNAGWGWLRPIADTDEALLRETFEINLFAPARLIRRAWPMFLRQGSGCVVNVSSGAAHDPYPGFHAYAASKAALESLGRSIAAEAAERKLPGIRAYSVAPGAVETPLLRSVFSEAAMPRSMAMDPSVIAGHILECIEGSAGVPSGGTVKVFGPA